MKERCADGASHSWELNSDGFVNVSNGAMCCIQCGHIQTVPLDEMALKRATEMTGIAVPESERGGKMLPGLGG